MDYRKVFCDRLRKVRLEKDLTQEVLSEAIREPREKISQWEKGARFPGMARLIIIADYLDVSLDYLVGRTDNRMPSEPTQVIEETVKNEDENQMD